MSQSDNQATEINPDWTWSELAGYAITLRQQLVEQDKELEQLRKERDLCVNRYNEICTAVEAKTKQ